MKHLDGLTDRPAIKIVGQMKDLTNRRSGKLVSLRPVARNEQGNVLWECRCDCGRYLDVVGAQLLRPNRPTRSCGCYKDEVMSQRYGLPTGKGLASGEAARNQVLIGYKRHAKRRDNPWTLTAEQAFALFEGVCHYCGIPPFRERTNTLDTGRKGMSGSYKYNGIDRVDNRLGYTAENTVSCCSHCNMAKRQLPYHEFIAWIHRAAKHLRKRGRQLL
jgi:hypothetical protein